MLPFAPLAATAASASSSLPLIAVGATTIPPPPPLVSTFAFAPDVSLRRRRRGRRRRRSEFVFAPLSARSTTGDGGCDDGDDEFGFGYGDDNGAAAASPLSPATADENGGVFEYDDEDDEAFLRRELAHLESLEGILGELEDGTMERRGDDDDAEMDDFLGVDDATLLELLGLPDGEDYPRDLSEFEEEAEAAAATSSKGVGSPLAGTPLEKALLQGVVPEDAGVGSGTLPGDYGFDPLGFAEKDYFVAVQTFLLSFLGGGKNEEEEEDPGAAMPRRGFVNEKVRPKALVLRDYREAEIRHGRLAMLAAVLWPIQELLDRLLIPQSFGATTVVRGGPTLPYVPLLMTGIMLLLGYLDIFAKAIKEEDAGEAFLPGECFWDPLSVLRDAPTTMKRNMQERELFNGRVAMIAIAAFFFEEATTQLPLIEVPGNEVFFEPAYLIPAVQSRLDDAFGRTPSPTFTFPDVGTVDFVEVVRDMAE